MTCYELFTEFIGNKTDKVNEKLKSLITENNQKRRPQTIAAQTTQWRLIS